MKNNIYDFIFTILYIELRPTIMNVLNYARKYFNKEHHIREKLIKIKKHMDPPDHVAMEHANIDINI